MMGDGFWRRAWIWSQDGAPIWFCAWIGEYMWRPWCWARGWHQPHHCDAHFEMCVLCRKSLWGRSRCGTPNPFIGVDRVPAAWRRMLGREMS